MRLLLALLLMTSPLLPVAQATQWTPSPPDIHAAASDMPCHASAAAAQTGDADPTTPCPHCSGKAPASTCHCGGYTAPAGLVAAGFRLLDVTVAGSLLLPMASDALPDSPGERLFRPPI